MAEKTPKKKNKKDRQLIVRVTAGERQAFIEICDRLDTSASREIRRFMREFVAAKDVSANEDGANKD